MFQIRGEAAGGFVPRLSLTYQTRADGRWKCHCRQNGVAVGSTHQCGPFIIFLWIFSVTCEIRLKLREIHFCVLLNFFIHLKNSHDVYRFLYRTADIVSFLNLFYNFILLFFTIQLFAGRA